MNKAFSPSPNFESHVKLVRLPTKRTCCEEQRVSENQAATSERTAKTLAKVQLEKHGLYSSEWSRPRAHNERLKSVRLNQLSVLSAHRALEPNSLGRALHHSTHSVTTFISPTFQLNSYNIPLTIFITKAPASAAAPEELHMNSLPLSHSD